MKTLIVFAAGMATMFYLNTNVKGFKVTFTSGDELSTEWIYPQENES